MIWSSDSYMDVYVSAMATDGYGDSYLDDYLKYGTNDLQFDDGTTMTFTDLEIDAQIFGTDCVMVQQEYEYDGTPYTLVYVAVPYTDSGMDDEYLVISFSSDSNNGSWTQADYEDFVNEMFN